MSDLSAHELPRLITTRVERPASGGGVARADDGRVTFVRHALPGELVRVSLKEMTTSFYRGDAIEVLEASDERVSPPCPYAHPGGCGGCDLQHASPVAQRSWKAALVSEHLRRIAGLEWEINVEAAPSAARGSRTRLRCGVNDDGHLALRTARSHDLVAIDACWIADARFAPAFERRWSGVSEVELRALGDDAPFAVATKFDERGSSYDLRSLVGDALNPSTRSRVRVGEHVFTVGPHSFWQAHRDAPAVLVDEVMDAADAQPGDDVVDLFSGVGLFAVPLAQRVGIRGTVRAIESSPFAVRDARENAHGFAQIKVRQWAVSSRSVNDAVTAGAIVVLDPPRGGLAKGVAASLVRRGPARIVYVSCDASTFARDLKTFISGGYLLRRVRAFDLFPMTEHVELVTLLDRPT